MIRFIRFRISSMHRALYRYGRMAKIRLIWRVLLDTLGYLEDHRNEQQGTTAALMSNAQVREVSCATTD